MELKAFNIYQFSAITDTLTVLHSSGDKICWFWWSEWM